MFRKTFFLFTLVLFFSCQQEDLQTETLTSMNANEAMENLNSLTTQIDASILESDWWKNLHPTTQMFVGVELSSSQNVVTFPELQKRFQQVELNNILRAQNCPGYPDNDPTGNVTLNSQADVDAFGDIKCKKIVGFLEIIDTLGDDPICDLTPLKGIKEVGSNLTVNADCLTSLDGLEKIKSIGELGPFGFVGIIGENLTDISALSKVKTLTGSLNIIECNSLTTVSDAFSEITSIESGKTSAPLTSIFVLNIDGNDLLTDLSAFNDMSYIEGGFRILDNASILDLDDFSGLDDVGRYIWVFDNAAIQNVNELSNITTLTEDLFVFDNPSLTECCGLYNLLCSDPPLCTTTGVVDIVGVFNNGAGCTDLDIIANGPCP